jgi:uncharacterized repeat protein (TIGR01451 family)
MTHDAPEDDAIMKNGPLEPRPLPAAEAVHLPAWWRHLLLAVATLILCSCRGLPAPPQFDESDLAFPEPSQSAVTIGDLYGEPFATAPGGPVPLLAPNEAYSLDGMYCPTTTGGPVDGTPPPARDEFLCDGGDFGTPVGVREDWTIEGLEQQDAIAHYDTLDGRTLVVPSNRVCVYAPRFASVRQVVNPLAGERSEFVDAVVDERLLAKAAFAQSPATSLQRHAPAINLADMPAIIFRGREKAGGLENIVGTRAIYEQLEVYADLQIIRLGQVDGRERPLIERGVQAALTWFNVQAPQVLFDARAAQAQMGVQQVGIVYQTDGPESPRLRLVKLASTGHALPGEEVEFTLRYDNVGDQAIGNVTIVDNLATRLEYIPDSARSTADATFVTTPNETGSTILRWEIKAPLEPGEGGVLQFRVRVR